MVTYEFAHRAYHGDRLYEKGMTIELSSERIPGPHMKPVTIEAKAAAKKHGVVFTGEVPDALAKLLPQYEDALAKAKASGGTIDAKELAAAFKDALGALLDPKARAAEFDAAVDKAVSERLTAEVDKAVAAALARMKDEKAARVAAEAAASGTAEAPKPKK